MSGLPDIQQRVQAIVGDDDLTTVAGLGPEQTVFDAEEAHGLFVGDVPCGVTLKGSRGLFVDGSVVGTASSPVRLETRGPIIVAGDVRHAVLRGDGIEIDGEVRSCQLSSAASVRVGHTEAGTKLVAGAYEGLERRSLALAASISRLLEQRQSLDRVIAHEQKRLHRSSRSTRIPIDFNMGRMIRHERESVVIDLSIFYERLGRMPGANSRALSEFFHRGIAGLLARKNTRYIGGNTLREKIFMQILRTLSQVIRKVHERNVAEHRYERFRHELESLVERVSHPRYEAVVEQQAAAGLHIEFPLPEVRRLDGDRLAFTRRSATALLAPGSSGQLSVRLTDASGELSDHVATRSEMRGVRFSVTAGSVTWSHLEVADETNLSATGALP